ncbi:clathrin coat assembly protein [Melia azedarach]|uniref:Clathrin coat assembly protein n=1 Tax=Melia azedarach TaxID=155640 RepID=A0ACC1Z4Z4_MELAZ|nr:clathrin coat assembly protein [Melia azedarach]
MPSKLKKAIGAVKDQTSISLAKVSNTNASNVEVLILKATRHDEVPVEDRYVSEILHLISSSKVYAVACAQVISKRIGKTRNWIVALKSLMLVLRIFQDGDPYFPREVNHAMKRGHKILNLSNFRDDSKSSPWDYTAFVRTFALYLDERLDCFITGKLHRRFTNRERENGRQRRGYEAVCDMKPIMLLDRISNWQRLLDRAMGSRPTGAAKNNRLVQICLYAVVQESFDLYRDISDALALLLDSFFHLQYQSCVSAFQACVRASKQFEELCSFYDTCKSIGVGRTSEYPSVQKVSDELIETLQEFLKDQASFPTVNGRSPLMLPVPPVKDLATSSDHDENWDQSFEPTGNSERESEYGSHCTSLEDLMSGGTSPSPSIEHLVYLTERGASPGPSIEHCSQSEQSGKPPQQDETICAGETGMNDQSLSNEKAKDRSLDIFCFDNWPPQGEQKQDERQEQQGGEQNSTLESTTGARDNWELELFQSTTKSSGNLAAAENLRKEASEQQSQYNPFLEDGIDMSSPAIVPVTNEQQTECAGEDSFSVAPTFQATPTFSSRSPNESAKGLQSEDDPFGPCSDFVADNFAPNGSVDQQMVLQQQQLWLQNQNKIIAKHMA